MDEVRPNAWEKPKPSIGCSTLAPLIVALDAAYAVDWSRTTRPLTASTAAVTASAVFLEVPIVTTRGERLVNRNMWSYLFAERGAADVSTVVGRVVRMRCRIGFVVG